MKVISLEKIENIQGGGDVSDAITGACVAVGFLGAIKVIAVSGPVGAGLIGVCTVNFLGGALDWW